METKNEIKIGDVSIAFQISLQVATTTSLAPTEFTRNYIETLFRIAGEHFVKQMSEAMIERIHEDFAQYPQDQLWKTK